MKSLFNFHFMIKFVLFVNKKVMMKGIVGFYIIKKILLIVLYKKVRKINKIEDLIKEKLNKNLILSYKLNN